MTIEQAHRADWLQALRRYLGVSIVANLVWEILQLPLYTLWATGTRREQAFAVLHCTIGDAMIAGLSLLAALALFARATWPRAGVARVYAGSLAFGVVYTIFSEWLNTSVRGSWAYSDLMPGRAFGAHCQVQTRTKEVYLFLHSLIAEVAARMRTGRLRSNPDGASPRDDG